MRLAGTSTLLLVLLAGCNPAMVVQRQAHADEHVKLCSHGVASRIKRTCDPVRTTTVNRQEVFEQLKRPR